jgi:hypothetical protein
MLPDFKSGLAFYIFLLSASIQASTAQNKVVVIPLMSGGITCTGT